MHQVSFRTNDAGLVDVLINGASYRIHRNLDAAAAKVRAAEICEAFSAQGERSRIVGAA